MWRAHVTAAVGVQKLLLFSRKKHMWQKPLQQKNNTKNVINWYVWNCTFIQTHLIEESLLATKWVNKTDLELTGGRIIVWSRSNPQSTTLTAISSEIHTSSTHTFKQVHSACVFHGMLFLVRSHEKVGWKVYAPIAHQKKKCLFLTSCRTHTCSTNFPSSGSHGQGSVLCWKAHPVCIGGVSL